MPEYVYVIYDSRYHGDPDAAIILTNTESLREAREFVKDFPDSVIMRCIPRRDNPDVWDEDRIISNSNPYFESTAS